MIRLSLLAFFLASATAQAAPPVYVDTELQARTNLLVNDNGWNLPPGSSFNSISASINDDSQVAFTVGVVPSGSSSHPGVWSGAHGVGELVFEGPSDAFVSSVSPINSSGSIVFTLSDTGGADGIYVYDATTGSASRLGTSPVIPNSYSSPGINSSGVVGYQANFSGGRALASTGGGSSLFHVTDRGVEPSSPYTYIYTPAFNDQRNIAAKVATSDDQFTNVEIRIFSSDQTSQLILRNQASDPQSAYSKFDNGLALNNQNVVAVIATRAADNRRVVLRSDGSINTEIAEVDPAGTIRELESFAPAINDGGWVVFRAKDANGQAIYVGDGKQLIRVVGVGDVVATDLGKGQLGQHDSSPVFSGAPAINTFGDVAFVAALHPQGDNQVEWGSGVFVAYAEREAKDDTIFVNGFED